MAIQANEFYHVYNQGNNRQKIFFTSENYTYFLRQFREMVLPYCNVINYCLMPNHFHFLIDTTEKSCEKVKIGSLELTQLTNGFRKLLSIYASAINIQEKRSGSLFRQKTKYSLVDGKANEKYLENCFHYIHQNPMEAGLVKDLKNWEHSSFKDYTGFRNGTLCDKNIAEKYIDINPENILRESEQNFDFSELEKYLNF